MRYQTISRLPMYGLIVLSPLLLGSNRPIFWSFNALLAGLALSLFVLSEWQYRHQSKFSWGWPLVTSATIIAFSLIGTMQALPGMPAGVAHPAWQPAPFEGGGWESISVAPFHSLQAVAWLSPLAVFLVAFRVGTSSRDGSALLRVMLATITFVAAFGLLTLLLEIDSLGLAGKTAYEGWLTGTFVNRNTAAAFFAIGLAVSLALVRCPGSDRPTGVRYLWAVIGLLAISVVLTGSRGGLLAAVFGCAVVLVLAPPRTLRPAQMVASALLAIAGAAAVAVAWLGRSGDAAGSNVSRLSLYSEAWDAILERPILGHGAGTYEVVEPLFHRETTPPDLIWNHAHSSLLEAAASIGLPATLGLMAILAAMVFHLARSFRARPEPGAQLVLAAIGGTSAALFHGIFDFSLETQAIALYVAILCGAGLGRAAALNSQTLKASRTAGVATW